MEPVLIAVNTILIVLNILIILIAMNYDFKVEEMKRKHEHDMEILRNKVFDLQHPKRKLKTVNGITSNWDSAAKTKKKGK